MCLERATTKQPRIAKKDIVCYKLAVELDDGRIVTKFKVYEIELNRVLTVPIFGEINKWRHVNEGFHTFATLGDIEYQKDAFGYYWGNVYDENHSRGHVLILKATIPKGTRFFKGECGECVSYSSESIIYEKL